MNIDRLITQLGGLLRRKLACANAELESANNVDAGTEPRLRKRLPILGQPRIRTDLPLFVMLSALSFAAYPNNWGVTLIDNGFYTTDWQSGLAWLDVTETRNMSFQYVSSQMDVGNPFYGWRYATAAEFNTLVSHAIDGIPSPENYLDNLVSSLGMTYFNNSGDPSNQYRTVYGFLIDHCTNCYLPTPDADYRYVGVLEDRVSGGNDYWSTNALAAPTNFQHPFYGSLLVRDANLPILKPVGLVPEPETYAMMLAGLGLIGARAKARKARRQVM